METKYMGKYDIVVIGAGHAGCEAALAAARMGKKVLIFSINLEAVANMFCNPAIGGTGKGHLVREIDALGGYMGQCIDKTFIQSRMLNSSKGPAVQSLRAQADKRKYHEEMKRYLEKMPNLYLKQAEVIDIDFDDSGKVKGVLTKTGSYYECGAAIIATGTFLRGKIFIGDSNFSSGPNGLAPSLELADNLKAKGMKLRRFKTGTPCRALSSSIDYSKMEKQEADEHVVPFSFLNENLDKEQVPCYLTYTNKTTHEILRENFSRSALFGGDIEGVGPRYCPSIESKVERFADKERHQCFVEPEGLTTEEMYLQGMSSSMPEDVQEAFYRSMPGLENIEIVRPAYAIEYDCINPLDIKLNLEHRQFSGLFCAGQFNGSSGYEEAACQGLMAGANASLWLDGKEPFILDRSEAYIGVLIDDLVTKGTNEPYRIMTSRAEYRLVLRQDNADERLSERAMAIGLIPAERYEKFLAIKEAKEKEIERLRQTKYKGVSLAELLKRPENTYASLENIDSDRPQLSQLVKTKVEVEIKYEGYIAKQLLQIEKFKKLEKKALPGDIDYMAIDGLRLEAREKLNDLRPTSVGQASRISGVSPADINVLLVYLEKLRRSI
ncbi:MAG: tRNA uridine-5-carboxymethylaminomethyl(34) synthesis enzyme MnmG [Bacillota bacterium]|nr:tRNA uridine-5-carboxymethylaminomethyl(34) synthesis enzyme MnmG [Bacillota bacterium]